MGQRSLWKTSQSWDADDQSQTILHLETVNKALQKEPVCVAHNSFLCHHACMIASVHLHENSLVKQDITEIAFSRTCSVFGSHAGFVYEGIFFFIHFCFIYSFIFFTQYVTVLYKRCVKYMIISKLMV